MSDRGLASPAFLAVIMELNASGGRYGFQKWLEAGVSCLLLVLRLGTLGLAALQQVTGRSVDNGRQMDGRRSQANRLKHKVARKAKVE